MNEYTLIHDASDLRRLIAENPTLPIVVLAGEEACSYDWYWTYCCDVKFGFTEILDMKTPYDDDGGKIFTDRDELYEAVFERFEDDPRYADLESPEFDAAVNAEVKKYESGWIKAIAIYATN